MALSSTNCYVTRADANSYFDDRIDSDTWTDASDANKDKALITATSILDDQIWAGIAVDEDQPLAFPRSGSYFDPRVGYEICLPDDIPTPIKIATYELALHLLTNSNLLDSTGTVENLEVGPISLTRIGQTPKIPGVVLRKIRPLLLNGGSRLWWRAN